MYPESFGMRNGRIREPGALNFFHLRDQETKVAAIPDFEDGADRLGYIKFGFNAGNAFFVKMDRAGFDEPWASRTDGARPNFGSSLVSRTSPMPLPILRTSMSSWLSRWLKRLVKLNLPSTCGLFRLEMKLGYRRNPQNFRPSGVDVHLNSGDERVSQGVIRPRSPIRSL